MVAVNRHEHDGLGILLTHGVADASTTLVAYRAVGLSGEANPIVRELLDVGALFAFGLILFVVGSVAIVYPSVAERAEFPSWFGPGLIAVGGLVALLNVLVVLSAA